MKNVISRERCIRTIRSMKNEKCKHDWKMFESKSWFVHSLHIYCSKCGSWEEII